MKINFKENITGFWQMNNFASRIKKILLILGKDAFLFILFIFLVEIIFSEFLFYRYVLSVEIQEPSLSGGFVGFREKEYESILKEWQSREDFLKNYYIESSSNPFQ